MFNFLSLDAGSDAVFSDAEYIEREHCSMAPPTEPPPPQPLSSEQRSLAQEIARDYVQNAENVDILVRYLRENELRLM
jgi:hypothetical protein